MKTIDPKLLKHVERPVMKDGRAVTRETKGGSEPVLRAVKADEVLDYAVRGDVVTVVTTDGRKYSGPVPKGYKAEA